MLEIPADATIEQSMALRAEHLAKLARMWEQAKPYMWERYFSRHFGPRDSGYSTGGHNNG